MQKRLSLFTNDAPIFEAHEERREPEAPRSFLLDFVRSLAIASARKDHKENMERRNSEEE